MYVSIGCHYDNLELIVRYFMNIEDLSYYWEYFRVLYKYKLVQNHITGAHLDCEYFHGHELVNTSYANWSRTEKHGLDFHNRGKYTSVDICYIMTVWLTKKRRLEIKDVEHFDSKILERIFFILMLWEKEI